MQVFIVIRKKNAYIVIAVVNIHSAQKLSLDYRHSLPQNRTLIIYSWVTNLLI